MATGAQQTSDSEQSSQGEGFSSPTPDTRQPWQSRSSSALEMPGLYALSDEDMLFDSPED